MAAIKTKATKKSAASYIASIKDPKKRKDAQTLLKMFQSVTKQKPVVWGNSSSGFIGFGTYHYKSERSAQEGNWPLTGFSARVQNLTVYIMSGFAELKPQLKKLGPHKTSVSCLYIKRLDQVDQAVLKEIVAHSYKAMQKSHGKA